MKHLTSTGIAVAALLTLVSCGGSSQSAGPASYLAVSNSKVAFIQWHATPGGHLDGTITAGSADGSAPAETLSMSHVPFSGTINRDSVRLAFPVPYFLHAGAQGAFSGGTLRLRFPQPDGTIRQATFSQSDLTSYASAVARLRRTIRRANDEAARQLAAHGRRSARVQAEQGAQRSLGVLYRDSSLAVHGALARGMSRFAGHLQTARSDLTTEKHDAVGGERYCIAASRVAGDAQSVDGDLKTVQGDVESVRPDIIIVRSEVMAAKAALRSLTRTGVPVPRSAYQVITSARASIGSVIAAANSYIDQINAIHSQARSISNGLTTGRCSGAQSGSWTAPIAHLR